LDALGLLRGQYRQAWQTDGVVQTTADMSRGSSFCNCARIPNRIEGTPDVQVHNGGSGVAANRNSNALTAARLRLERAR